MDKQEKRIIIRIDGKTKEQYIVLCDKTHMTISSRLKYLMKMDIDNKLTFK
jgi:hypothetical protein